MTPSVSDLLISVLSFHRTPQEPQTTPRTYEDALTCAVKCQHLPWALEEYWSQAGWGETEKERERETFLPSAGLQYHLQYLSFVSHINTAINSWSSLCFIDLQWVEIRFLIDVSYLNKCFIGYLIKIKY